MHRVPEEVRELSALLKSELDTWPGITYRKMFGMTAAYRKGVIFAGLPDKRALITERSVIFKFAKQSPSLEKRLKADGRVLAGEQPGQMWFGFELESVRDINSALAWLNLAYEAAAAKPRKR